jgi:hypothetical protein
MAREDWRLLEDHPALSKPDWLPPGAEWPELAELRAEHERLLTARAEAWTAAGEVVGVFNREDEARDEALRQSFRTGKAPEEVDLTPPEEREAQRLEAVRAWEMATDVLCEFLRGAIRELAERSSTLYAELELEAEDAELKKAEAARLLAEADRQVREVWRKSAWLDRGSGRSTLGHYPFAEIPLVPVPEALDLEQISAGGMTTVVECV